jgi:hypothetical protein
MGIHLLWCVHGNEHIGTHDAIRNIFVTIAWDAGFHVGQEQLHVLPSTTFNFFHRWVDIVFTKNGIRTLINLVIVDPMWTYLFPRSCTIQGFVASNVVQAKERSNHNWHPTDQFLPLTIEIFDYLHKLANVFLHNYANAIWSLKGTKGFHFSTLVTFFCQKISITLQRMEASSILSQAIAIRLATSQLPPLQDTTPITMTDLLQAVDFWHVNMVDLSQAVGYGRA